MIAMEDDTSPGWELTAHCVVWRFWRRSTAAPESCGRSHGLVLGSGPQVSQAAQVMVNMWIFNAQHHFLCVVLYAFISIIGI